MPGSVHYVFVNFIYNLHVQDLIDMARVTMIDPGIEEKLLSAFELAKETVDDFTDSPYTSHDNREKVLQLTEKLREELQTLLMVGRSLVKIYCCFCLLYCPYPYVTTF